MDVTESLPDQLERKFWGSCYYDVQADLLLEQAINRMSLEEQEKLSPIYWADLIANIDREITEAELFSFLLNDRQFRREETRKEWESQY